MIAVFACLFAVPVAALAEPVFPGSDPAESPRLNTPNDPSFDRCEVDDEDGTKDCDSYFNEDFRLFGFSPDTANEIPGGLGPHAVIGTRYRDCSQLDPQGMEANRDAEAAGIAAEPNPVLQAAGNLAAPCLQIAGIRADTAWKYSIGDPETTVAILDTGIMWQDAEPRQQGRSQRG